MLSRPGTYKVILKTGFPLFLAHKVLGPLPPWEVGIGRHVLYTVMEGGEKIYMWPFCLVCSCYSGVGDDEAPPAVMALNVLSVPTGFANNDRVSSSFLALPS